MSSPLAFSAFLPEGEGYLPYWMLFVSSLAIFNSAQNFLTTSLTRKIFSKSPASVTALQARTFAVWTLASAAIRIYAAYNINVKGFYDLALISYVLALGHFVSELVIFKTAGIGAGLISPLIVASTSLIWMTRPMVFLESPTNTTNPTSKPTLSKVKMNLAAPPSLTITPPSPLATFLSRAFKLSSPKSPPSTSIDKTRTIDSLSSSSENEMSFPTSPIRDVLSSVFRRGVRVDEADEDAEEDRMRDSGEIEDAPEWIQDEDGTCYGFGEPLQRFGPRLEQKNKVGCAARLNTSIKKLFELFQRQHLRWSRWEHGNPSAMGNGCK
ncbi:hypothetical protein MNV49_000146 [Pseudohyphozyma bogoriensis]|nr:hypothetical protein MNV49_000146 [Pseudohyphozyma bogoriensis]